MNGSEYEKSGAKDAKVILLTAVSVLEHALHRLSRYEDIKRPKIKALIELTRCIAYEMDKE